MKITVLYFLALSPTTLKSLSSVGDGVKNCLAMSATAIKMLSDVADSATNSQALTLSINL